MTRAVAQAIALARRGPEYNPNPRVGCVLLNACGENVGEGWHRGRGHPHAEVEALTRWREQSGSALKLGAPHTAVVTLEPCAHTGCTGPCAEVLIGAGVQQVVYVVDDPSGRGGATRLREAGIRVVRWKGDELLAAATSVCQAWLLPIKQQRPWVVGKWAQSLDGRTAAADGSSQWISNRRSRQLVQELRGSLDAIAVGAGTLIADDPELTCRRKPMGPGQTDRPPDGQPLPVIFSASPERFLEKNPAGQQSLRIFQHPRRPVFLSGADLRDDLHRLYRQGVSSLLLEGGARLMSSFIAADLIDEYWVFLAPKLLGGGHTATAELGVPDITQARELTITGVTLLEETADDSGNNKNSAAGDILVRALPKAKKYRVEI